MEEIRLETGQRAELLANVKRLMRIVLDRLEAGSNEGTLDQGQVRMLCSIALRSLRLWKEALARDPNLEKRDLSEAEAVLAQKPSSATEKG